MRKYIYRYISFESFVGMVQSKQLIFVLPETWEDPMEGSGIMNKINNCSSLEIIYKSVPRLYWTFAQCWSRAYKSDAMWRIYSYNNKSIRIKILESDVQKLNGVDLREVRYDDNPRIAQIDDKESFITALSVKRKAFSHEKEVRLFYRLWFEGVNDNYLHKRCFDYLAAENVFEKIEIKKELEKMGIDFKEDDPFTILNMGENKIKRINITFDHIPNFIQGVMVHPLAEDWYVKIVEDFCKNNKIRFEGKSTLYERKNL